MSKLLKNSKFRIALLTIAVLLAIACYLIYKSGSTTLIDKEAYMGFRTMIEETGGPEGEGINSQRQLMDMIEKWADDNGIEYKEDKSGNIIFNKPAVKRKKNVSPTLVAVSMNYETAYDNARILASAAAIAQSDLESGRRIVVFANDEQGLSEGYKRLNKKYLTSKTKAIYLDKGSSTYLSTGSFQQRCSSLTVPAAREENSFDTAVTIRISGLKSGIIGPGISKQPDPFSALSTLLTRLKSKSVECRLAEVSIGSNGNMYPVSLEVTVVLNSYNLSSFTGYIDKRIKAWEKAYGENLEDLVYEYEVDDSEDALPETVYTAEATDKLTGVLYTIKSGAYKYSASDAIPEGKEEGDIYGINCLTAIETDDDSITIKMITQGYDDTYTDRITTDNKAASELYECKYKITGTVPAFSNDRDSLSRTFINTYKEVNKSAAVDPELAQETDNFFTPCSYLAGINEKADIIHIRTKSSEAARIANTILCYLKAKGNTTIF